MALVKIEQLHLSIWTFTWTFLDSPFFQQQWDPDMQEGTWNLAIKKGVNWMQLTFEITPKNVMKNRVES